MAHTGNGSSGKIVAASSISASSLTRPYFHFWYQNANAPGGAVIDIPFAITDAGLTYQINFAWDSTIGAGQKAVNAKEAGGTVRRAQLTSSLSANTWYAIGGFYDGTNAGVVLNGTTEATTACAALSTAANPTPSALAAAVGTSDFDDGTIAEVAAWNLTTAMTQAEWTALAAGVSPLLIRPQSLILYWPLINDAVAAVGSRITATDTTVATHPRMYYPASPQISYVDDVGSAADITMHLSDSCSFAEVNSKYPGDLQDTVTMTESITLDNFFGPVTDTVVCTERYRAGTQYLASGRLRDIPGSRRP